MRSNWPAAFFAVSACSWMPHWACHFYRLETGSTFVVGSWEFSVADSMIALLIYSTLVLANIVAATAPSIRPVVAMISGTLHIAFGVLHAYRLYRPFRFEVLGYPWSMTSSAREFVIVGLFGLLSIMIGLHLTQSRTAASSASGRTGLPT